MWSGRIIALFPPLNEQSLVYRPQASLESHPSSGGNHLPSSTAYDAEEMLLRLPEDLCFGTGIHDGASVYVAYQMNPPVEPENPYSLNHVSEIEDKMQSESNDDIDKWLRNISYSDDIAGWIIVSPFPIELLPTRIMQLIFRLKNKPGAFYEAVAEPIARKKATMLQVEGMATGDEGSLVLLPDVQNGDELKYITINEGDEQKEVLVDAYCAGMIDLIKTLNEQEDQDWFTNVMARVPKNVYNNWPRCRGAKKDKAPSFSVQPIGWLEELVNPLAATAITGGEVDVNELINTKEKLGKDLALTGVRFRDVRSRKVRVRDRMVVIPWGEITRGIHYAQGWVKKNSEKERDKPLDIYDVAPSIPKYVLLAREPDLPIVVGVIPKRMLFQIYMRLRSAGGLHEVGVDSIKAISEFLRKQNINIWHIQQLPAETTFTSRLPEKKGKPTKKEDKSVEKEDKPKPVWDFSFIESEVKIVAACPPGWRWGDAESMEGFFNELRRKLAQLRVPKFSAFRERETSMPSKPSEKKILHEILSEARRLKENDVSTNTSEQSKFEALPELEEWLNQKTWDACVAVEQQEYVRDAIEKWRPQKKDEGDFTNVSRRLEGLLNSSGEPIVSDPDKITVHAPPILRVFLSHSVSPSDTERDFIVQIKSILERYAVKVEEGQFTGGLSTEELSRGRIRLCTALVSLLWPREYFKDAEGKYTPPEWVMHEESFALGLGLRVFRIKESEVRNPLYEYDRPVFEFSRDSSQSWEGAKKKFEKDFQQFILEEAAQFIYGRS